MTDSKWFGKKYRVTPESGKVLQGLLDVPRYSEMTYSKPYLFVHEGNKVAYCEYGDEYYYERCMLEDGTLQLEEYMNQVTEKEDITVYVECPCSEATRVVIKDDVEVYDNVTKLRKVYTPRKNATTSWTTSEGVVCTTTNPYTYFYKKVETIEVDGKKYIKEEYEAAINELQEVK